MEQHPPSDNGVGPMPPQGDEWKSAMREIVGQALALQERSIMEQVEARNAKIVAGLQVKVDEVAASLAAQVNSLVKPASSASPPAAAAGPAEKVVSTFERIVAILEKGIDTLAPKTLDLYGQWKMAQSPWMYDMQAAMQRKQADPMWAAMMGQALAGANPYEQVVPTALMNGIMWGLRTRGAVLNPPQGGAPSLTPTLSDPNPSASSSGATSPSSQPKLPVSSVSMTNANGGRPSVKAKRLSDVMG